MKRFLCSLLFVLFSFIGASAQRVYVLYTNGVPTNCVTGNLYVDRTTGNIYSWKLGVGCIISGNVNGVSGSGVSGRISYWNGVSSLTSITGFTFDGLNLSIPTGGQFRINGTAFNFSNLAGNINVSQMNSGTGASSTTFWRGDGTWATPVSVNPTSGNIPYNNGGSFADSLLSQSTGNINLASGQLLLPVGTAANPSFSFTGRTGNGIFSSGSSAVDFAVGGTLQAEVASSARFYLLNNSAQILLGTSSDTILNWDAANTLALRNSTNPQTLRIYNTFTDTSNYERGESSWVSNTWKIGTAWAGTGVARGMQISANDIQFSVGNLSTATTIAHFANTGHLLWNTDNTFDIGANGASRPRNVYLASQLFITSTITGAGTTGNQTINNAAGTVRIAAGNSSVVVTSNKATTSSLVFSNARTNDATCYVKSIVPASGSFTINTTAACTAETEFQFWILNQ